MSMVVRYSEAFKRQVVLDIERGKFTSAEKRVAPMESKGA